MLLVREQHSERALAVRGVGDDAVRLGGIVDREAVRRELRGVHAAGSHEIEERLHVALLGPADVAGGEVAAVLLVVAVVAAGAVRAGHAELELLLVEGRPVDVDPGLPDDDDAAAVAREARRRARAGRRRRTRRTGALRRGRARP